MLGASVNPSRGAEMSQPEPSADAIATVTGASSVIG
jgi:hypothetical protein